jgi:hypothetical protein
VLEIKTPLSSLSKLDLRSSDRPELVSETGNSRFEYAHDPQGHREDSINIAKVTSSGSIDGSPFTHVEPFVENPYSLGLYVLGQSGMKRLYRFATEYDRGWGDGSGEPLDQKILKCLFVFLRYAPINIESKPSIFMTPEGGLELAWDDFERNEIRVEFSSQTISYHFSKTGHNGSYPIKNARGLAETFQELE